MTPSEESQFFLLPGDEQEARYISKPLQYITLRECLEDPLWRQRTSLPEILQLFRRLCSLIGQLHRRGVVHRALSPEAIWFLPDGAVGLSNFGFSCRIGEVNEVLKATPTSYTPPEQMSQADALFEPRSDLFSLGVIFYEALTGRCPFLGSTPFTLMLAVLDEVPKAPSQLNPACPKQLDGLVLALLQKRVEQRPSSAEEIASSLEADLSPQPEKQAPIVDTAPPPTSMLQVGALPTSLLNVARERYQREGELARGGLGKITTAIDTRLGRRVAVKELLGEQEKAKGRFLREAMITAQLQHPGIVPVYEAGTWPNGEPFYAMKLVEGKPFDRVIQETSSLQERLALLPRVIDAAEALAYAHSKHIIHRDIKPHNIIVGDFGETVVIDWGLAKEIGVGREAEGGGKDETLQDRGLHSDDLLPSSQDPSAPRLPPSALTQTGEIMGTPAYMPLEQAKGEPVDARADVYSLGAILYHLLSGRAPYQEKESCCDVKDLFNSEPTPLAQLEPGAPLDLLAIVKKAMARLPGQRYPDASAFVEDVKKFQTGQLVGAKQYTVIERFKRFLYKYRRSLSALGVILVIVGVSVWRVNSANRAAFEANRAALKATKQKKEAEQENTHLSQEQAALLVKTATEERERLLELTLKNAKNLLEQDPSLALAELLKLPEDYQAGAQRIIAADAHSRGIPKRLKSFTSKVRQLEFSPDEKHLAAISFFEEGILLWNTNTWEKRALKGHQGKIRSLVFFPDSKHMASGGDDKTVRIWDIATGECVQIMTGHEDIIYSLSLSPSGAQLASIGRDKKIFLWEPFTTKSQLFESEGAPLLGLFSPDESRFITYGYEDNELSVWDIGCIKRCAPIKLKGHTAGVSNARFSPSGRVLASVGEDATIRFWDLTPRSLKVLDNGFVASWVQFIDDEILLTVGYSKFLQYLDINTEQAWPLIGHKDVIQSFRLFDEEGYFVSLSRDGTAIFWESATAPPRILSGFQGEPESLALSSSLIAAGDNNGDVLLWNIKLLSTKTAARGLEGSYTLALSPRGDLIAVSGISTKIFLFEVSCLQRSALSEQTEPCTPTQIFESPTGSTYALVFSLDGTKLFSGAVDGSIYIWDLVQKTSSLLYKQEGFIYSLVLSPDGKALASAGKGPIYLHQLETGESRPLAQNDSWVYSLQFIKNGERLLASNADNHLRLWEVSSSQLIQEVQTPGICRSLAISPDQQQVAAGCAPQILLWKLNDQIDEGSQITLGREIGSAHYGQIYGLSFSPDGRRLASAGGDSMVRLWDLKSGLSRALQGRYGTMRMVFWGDDETVLTLNSDRIIQSFQDALPTNNDRLRSWVRQALAQSSH